MRDLLPALHHPHNRRLRLELPVSGDTHVRLFVFFFRLFELDGIDFDAVLGMRKGSVEAESVSWGDFTTFGCFCKRSEFGTGKRLQSALDFGVGCKR
jgi:hypothetical protein